MITQGEDVEIHALQKQGWSISAIARHVNRDRKTVRKYLASEAEVGVRESTVVDPFDRVEPYVRQRLADDPHLRLTVLFAEVQALPCGYERAYQTFTRQLRDRGLRPHCEACAGSDGRAHVDIEHSPGEEVQWDWLELHATPWQQPAFVLVGSLSFSAKFRCSISESMDQPHLIMAIHEVLQRLGGTPKRWRVDRMATAIRPGTNELQPSFAPVAKHYGVVVDPCPPRRPNRKGIVENAIGYLTQSWWRTAQIGSVHEAQRSLDAWCETVADLRLRDAGDGGQVTVGALAETEPLLGLPPAVFPTEICLERTVAANGLVSVWGNQYSVPPQIIGSVVDITHRHGTNTIDIASNNRAITSHTLAPKGAHRIVRLPEHTRALENVVLGAFTTDRPCQTKLNRPPTQAALAIASQLGADLATEPVVDLDVYRQITEGDLS